MLLARNLKHILGTERKICQYLGDAHPDGYTFQVLNNISRDSTGVREGVLEVLLYHYENFMVQAALKFFPF